MSLRSKLQGLKQRQRKQKAKEEQKRHAEEQAAKRAAQELEKRQRRLDKQAGKLFIPILRQVNKHYLMGKGTISHAWGCSDPMYVQITLAWESGSDNTHSWGNRVALLLFFLGK